MDRITLPDLSYFTGTENYYRHWTGALFFTDGVAALGEAGAMWLVDAIASYQPTKELRHNARLQQFQSWTLDVDEDKAVLTCREDSGCPAVVTQRIDYTTFPIGSFNLWVEAGWVNDGHALVLLLPLEH